MYSPLKCTHPFTHSLLISPHPLTRSLNRFMDVVGLLWQRYFVPHCHHLLRHGVYRRRRFLSACLQLMLLIISCVFAARFPVISMVYVILFFFPRFIFSIDKSPLSFSTSRARTLHSPFPLSHCQMKALLVLGCIAAACAVVSAGSWHVKTASFASVAASIDCESVTTCICPVVNNGVGSQMWVTTDGGNTWDSEQEPVSKSVASCCVAGNLIFQQTYLCFVFDRVHVLMSSLS
jgi:hypothetical protein